MPRRTVWVRDEDLDAFEAIRDRPEWLHKAIQASKRAPINLERATNIKVNADGTISSAVPGQPTSFTTTPEPFDEPHYEPVDDLP